MKISYVPRPINRNIPHRVTGFFASQKNEKHVVWESQLERDVCFLLEKDTSVISYETQSRTFVYIDHGKERTYTPDFYVRYADGKDNYLEVKPQKFVKKFKEDKKLILEEICENNIPFKIITDIEIRCGYFLENIKFLEHYSEKIVSEKTVEIINQLYQKRVSIKQLAKLVPLTEIYQLIYSDFFDVDLNHQLLSHDTILGVVK